MPKRMKTFYKPFCFLTVLFLFAFSARAAVHIVSVQEFEFVNSPSIVNVGDTIRWVWVNGSHTTTATAVPAGAASWDSPIDSSDPEFEYVVTEPGSYSYVCVPHSDEMSESFTAVGLTSNGNPTAGENVFAVKLESNDLVNVVYSVPQTAPVSIGLYDLTGKQLKSSAKQIQSPGTYSYNVAIDDVKSGMYFVVVQIGDERQTRKFTVR